MGTSVAFAVNFGDPRLSPWHAVEFGEVHAYDARRFVEAVLTLGPLSAEIMKAVGRHAVLGVRDEADLEALASFQEAEPGDAPASVVAAIAGLDLASLEEAVAAKTELEAFGDLRHEDAGRLGVAAAYVGNASSATFLDQAPAAAYEAATSAMARADALAVSLEGVSSILGFSGDDPASHFQVIATAGVIAGLTPAADREWVGALPHADVGAVAAAEECWNVLRDLDEWWAARLPRYDAGNRPDPADLEALATHVRAVASAE